MTRERRGVAPTSSVAERIALRSLAAREVGYGEEVRRLLDAGLVVMGRLGTGKSPGIAEVVAEAGTSNETFYRHFASKDEFIVSIMDAGTASLERHLVRQMDRAHDASGRVRAWVETMLRQAEGPEPANIIRAVLWNGLRVSDDTRRRGSSREMLAQLLVAPVAELGSSDPESDALLVCYACMLRLEEFLWRNETPTAGEIEHAVAFSLRAVAGPIR
ncbi:MAG: regulatory protein TetR [Acidimicrobiia bacterium]|nr:regulatory protein TetR [Acidimicrobiia bacterium]